MTYRYDAELAAVVDSLPELDLRDIPAARDGMARRRDGLAFEPSGSLRVSEAVTSSADGHPVRLRIVAPAVRTPAAGALLFLHGGGFVLGDVEDLAGPAEIAEHAGVVVVSVGYRLAPEHPYPAALDDSYAGLCWTHARAAELGADSERIAVGGISAGAGLAAALALLSRDRGGPAIAFQMLDIPVLDDRLATPSMQAFTDTPLWNRENARRSWAAYLGPGHRGEPPAYAAPARATDLRGLPPAYVVTCEFDPLRDEGIAYASRLMQAGVPTELHSYPGTFHGSGSVGAGTAISDRMTADRLQALRRAVG
jgi:acetyl esterase/lipase